MTIIRVGNAAMPSAARTYLQLRGQRLCELLGYWVSGLEPEIFERIDVSPQVLLEIGIGVPDASAPMFVASVTVDDMIAAGAIG